MQSHSLLGIYGMVMHQKTHSPKRTVAPLAQATHSDRATKPP